MAGVRECWKLTVWRTGQPPQAGRDKSVPPREVLVGRIRSPFSLDPTRLLDTPFDLDFYLEADPRGYADPKLWLRSRDQAPSRA